MPFRSKAQQRFMFSQHPQIAKEWAAKTDFKTLPQYAHSHSKGTAVASSTERLASKMAQSKKRNWMQGAVSHPGALHRQLGVPAGKKIPAKKLAAAASSSNTLLARRARLAQTFAKYRP